jgi:uncharacterized protein YdeI (YjbR/CyaY-like superfamily)
LLTDHHEDTPGIWLVTWKRAAAAHARATTIAAEALCFGWIDSRPRSTVTDRSALLVTPTSSWSRINKQRAEALTAADLMHPAGFAVVAAAQVNGSRHAPRLAQFPGRVRAARHLVLRRDCLPSCPGCG